MCPARQDLRGERPYADCHTSAGRARPISERPDAERVPGDAASPHEKPKKVPRRGLEPPPCCQDYHLKVARLPVPPSGRTRSRRASERVKRVGRARAGVENEGAFGGVEVEKMGKGLVPTPIVWPAIRNERHKAAPAGVRPGWSRDVGAGLSSRNACRGVLLRRGCVHGRGSPPDRARNRGSRACRERLQSRACCPLWRTRPGDRAPLRASRRSAAGRAWIARRWHRRRPRRIGCWLKGMRCSLSW